MVPFLLIILLTTLFQTYAYKAHCSSYYVGYGILSDSDARAATNLIPFPDVDRHATGQSSNGTIVYDLTFAAHQVRYPVIFHHGNAAIDISQVNLGGVQERLLASEQAFYLWRTAREVALHIITTCVDVSRGRMGGRVQFQVKIPGHPTRSFELVVERKPFNLQQLQQNLDAGGYHPNDLYQVWPPV